MERFYYDQDCEFRQRPFEVATYGEVVPFIRDADAGRLRLYMEREVPPGLYDARDNDKRIIMSFTCCLHFQDFRRSDQPPIVSAQVMPGRPPCFPHVRVQRSSRPTCTCCFQRGCLTRDETDDGWKVRTYGNNRRQSVRRLCLWSVSQSLSTLICIS